jgi:hypothetical protein
MIEARRAMSDRQRFAWNKLITENFASAFRRASSCGRWQRPAASTTCWRTADGRLAAHRGFRQANPPRKRLMQM